MSDTIQSLLDELEAKAKQAKPTSVPWPQWGKANLALMAACSPDRILVLVAYVRGLEQIAVAARKLNVSLEYEEGFYPEIYKGQGELKDALAALAEGAHFQPGTTTGEGGAIVRNRAKFLKALAQFLVGNQGVKSIELEMERKMPPALVHWASEWAALRNATPLFGYPTIEEAERQLVEFLGWVP